MLKQCQWDGTRFENLGRTVRKNERFFSRSAATPPPRIPRKPRTTFAGGGGREPMRR